MFFVENERAGGNWFKSFDTFKQVKNQGATAIPTHFKAKEDTMNHRQRTAYSVAAIFGLVLLISQFSSALAQNYTLNSLFSINQGLPQLPGITPSINNLGHVAYPRFV